MIAPCSTPLVPTMATSLPRTVIPVPGSFNTENSTLILVAFGHAVPWFGVNLFSLNLVPHGLRLFVRDCVCVATCIPPTIQVSLLRQ